MPPITLAQAGLTVESIEERQEQVSGDDLQHQMSFSLKQ